MKNQNEHEKRCKAIQLHNEGIGFNKILQLVQRGKFWLSKWLKRNGAAYFIRKKLERQYVVATIFTHRKRLVVKQDNRIIKSFSFPIKCHIVVSLLPITRRKT
ncbi:MAG: hypothetical protein Q7J61_05185 [Deltaproteobacteria bacterium]|nr:hypothetical protein [Deltaproteobacteria bacterium]